MTLYTQYIGRVARTPSHRTQWRRISRRYYSSRADGSAQKTPETHNGGTDEDWFNKLREEMLNRILPRRSEYIGIHQYRQLYATLHSLFRPDKQLAPHAESQWMNPLHAAHLSSMGDHLAYFNPTLPSTALLPDGTDKLHSPGGSFVRRMWAGGALRMNAGLYFDDDGGWHLNKIYSCVERIKDVRLHGQSDTAKIFVTIERRFARKDQLDRLEHRAPGSKNASKKRTDPRYFEKQLGLHDWGDAFLLEERNLVFMRERSAAELKDIKAGKFTPTRYVNSPGNPEFSYTLTPTSVMLFRFSAVTFNAHAIHLDRDYARNVEGHRNLLVHGPLTLMLMSKFVSGRLQAREGAPQSVESIEYRNLAPLYCDEQLRLCGREKKDSRLGEGSVYDVWIEGPTGGMAVKATVRTTYVPEHKNKTPGTNASEATKKT